MDGETEPLPKQTFRTSPMVIHAVYDKQGSFLSDKCHMNNIK